MLKNCYQTKLIEAGCDEAGRGPLAGPVVGAAVILPKRFKHPFLNDSKLLSHKQRQILRPIIEKKAIAYAVGVVSPTEIDEHNILNASILAVHRALSALKQQPEYIVMDGNTFKPYNNIKFSTIIKGDAKYLNIAAASVLAKEYRDELMCKLHKDYPHYCWDTNKGYPTKAHRKAILEHGSCEHHRKSFQLLPLKQGELFD